MSSKSQPVHRRETDGRSTPSHRNIRELRQDQLRKPTRDDRDDKGYMMELVGKHIRGVVTKPELRGTKYGHRREVPSPTSADDDDKEDEGEAEGDDEGDEEEDSDESSSTQHSSGESEDENPPRRSGSFDDKPSNNPSFVVLSVSRPRAVAEPPRTDQKGVSEKERTPRTRSTGEGMARGFRSQLEGIRKQRAGHDHSPERDSLEAVSEYELPVESRPIATPERRRHSTSLASQSPRDSTSLASPAGSPSMTSFVSSLPSFQSITSSQPSPTSDRSGSSSPSSTSMSPSLPSPRQPTLITFNNPSSTNPIVNPSAGLEKQLPTIITTQSVLPSPPAVVLPPSTSLTSSASTSLTSSASTSSISSTPAISSTSATSSTSSAASPAASPASSSASSAASPASSPAPSPASSVSSASSGTTITFNGPTISFTGPNFSANNSFMSSASSTNSMGSPRPTMPRPLSSSSLSSLSSSLSNHINQPLPSVHVSLPLSSAHINPSLSSTHIISPPLSSPHINSSLSSSTTTHINSSPLITHVNPSLPTSHSSTRATSSFNLAALTAAQSLPPPKPVMELHSDSTTIVSIPLTPSSTELVLDGTLMIGSIIRSITNLSNAAGVLNGQVDRFCAIVDKQTRDKNDHLVQVWDEVRKTVQGLWEGGVVETYGSFVTGLSLPSSDLDMVISAIGSHPKIVQMAVHSLKRRAGLAADWQPSAQEWFERLTRPLEPWGDALAQELYERLLQDAASESELIAHSRAGRSTLVLGLLALALELREQPWVHNLNPIITAKVPVIKLNATVYDHPPVVVDISFTERTLNEGQAPPLMSDADGAGPGHLHFGTAAARLVQAYIQDWPHLKKLALVLKQFLYIQNLHDTYTGGLSSYCLVVMIVSFLQAASQTESLIPHASNQPHPCSQVAVLLIAFLDFYGERFDYKSTGIRVCLPSNYNHNIPGAVIGRNCAIPGSFQNFFKLPRDSPTLYIEDPFNPKNNIGQSVFQFWKVSQAFSGAHGCMVDALQGKNWQYCEALCLLVGQINVPTNSSLPPLLPQTLSPLSLTLPLSTTLLPPSLPMTLSLTAQPPMPVSALAAIQPMLLAPNGLLQRLLQMPYSDDLGHHASHVYPQRRDRHLRSGQHQP